jgi:hypothetical protein
MTQVKPIGSPFRYRIPCKICGMIYRNSVEQVQDVEVDGFIRTIVHESCVLRELLEEAERGNAATSR